MTIASLADALSSTEPLSVAPLPAGAQGVMLADIVKETACPILHIVNSDREMALLATTLPFFTPDTDILSLPAWDCLPYDRVSPGHAITAQRINTLAELASRQTDTPFILLSTVGAAMQKLPPKELMRSHRFTIRHDDTLDRDGLIAFLLANGYSRVSKVMEPGEFALRGSIIDLFPPGTEDAVRIDLFGDEVDSLKAFDPLSQVSHSKVDGLTLQPVNEIMLNDETIARFRSGYREAFGAVTRDDPLYEAISSHQVYAGMEHWLPLFYERLDSLFDYVPKETILSQDHGCQQTLHDRLELLQDYYQSRLEDQKIKDGSTPYHPLPPEKLYLNEKDWQQSFADKRQVIMSPFADAGTPHAFDPSIRPSPTFASVRQHQGDVMSALRNSITARSTPTLIACASTGSMSRMETMAQHAGMVTQRVKSANELTEAQSGVACLAALLLEQGFDSAGYGIFSEQDILGERIIRTQKRRKPSDTFMAEAQNISAGELVVHKEHGIARFDGLETLEVNGARHDCLKLVYAGEDRLFLPVENMDLISRYGSEGEGQQLDKLGGVSWQKRKAALKKRIQIAAEELLRIAAKRVTHDAPTLLPDGGSYAEFCSRFPYAETDDQMEAIDDVLADLAKGTPMDRLICGDVGFGKTEVAMRAAFVAAAKKTDGSQRVQVAVITPTTLLARQHYQNFHERFKGFDITVKVLSRLISSGEAKKVKEGLADGSVDIVIGTHALLGKQIDFHNLGLLIVDEEQHFGVAQKEKLKQLRAEVHVLTLSATPIPRTLQMSLAGVRELSLITTPPVDRLAVRSFVMPYDRMVIREAILRELHRGGKSFYVTPRIKYMAELRQKIEELVPEVTIAAAHGQMTAGELDKVMNAFYDGKYDLLLSTAIIESGIDIPTANTMIIDHPEMFGLAQLYQLRGRVGRSKTRAYAYFTLPHRKTLTHHAVKRLEVMQTLDTLGAGFTLASHDMDIRGFGNLLGEEQSGHIREVGIELYQAMLEDAVEQARARKAGTLGESEKEEEWSPQINLGSSVLIPESYIEELDLRLALYRRLSGLHTQEEIESFAAELVDRFGELPEEVIHLLEVLRVKQYCKRAGIERIDVGPKGAIITFRNNAFSAPEKLLRYITGGTHQLKIRADQKLILTGSWKSSEDKLRDIHQSIEEIARLAA